MLSPARPPSAHPAHRRGRQFGAASQQRAARGVNAGHRRGGAVSRFLGGWSRKLPVFAPLAVAAIGTLPLPLMHRAIIINMQRHAPGADRLQQLEESDPAFAASRAEIQKWAATCSLAREPEMPSETRSPLATIRHPAAHDLAGAPRSQ